MKVPADPEDRTVSVCYRCKTCHSCFVTMEDINRHLQTHNHYILPEDVSSSSTEGDMTFPPLPLPAKQDVDLKVNSDQEGHRRKKNGDNHNDDPQGGGTVKGENGIRNNNKNGSGNGKGASPVKSYAASLKAEEDVKGSPKKPKLTEQDTVEDMETDGDITVPIRDEKLWPPVTSTSASDGDADTGIETGEAVTDSLPESNEILQKSKEAEPVARSPKKTITSGSSRTSSRTSSANNESDKAKKTEVVLNETPNESGVRKRATRNSTSASTSTSESCTEVPKIAIGNSTTKSETATTALPTVKEGNEQVSPDQSAAEPVTPSGSHQSPAKKIKSLSEALTSMKAKLNHMKWRDVPATAFTYSNQNQTLQNEQNVPESTAGGSNKKENKRKRYKCKLCDEWFAYTVQIISHVKRVHKTAPTSSTPNNPPSPKKSKIVEPSNKSSQSGQSYPLRSLHTRTRRSTTEMNKTSDTKEKKPRKYTKFTCKHCSQKFLILNQLKGHIHSAHPETVGRLNHNLRMQAKKRKTRRFRFSLKKRILPKPPSTGDSAISSSNLMELGPSVSTAIPETKPVENEDATDQKDSNGESHPKRRKRTMFSCKHCHEKFPLLNQLKIHLHQVHPNMMGKAKPSKNKVALNGAQKTENTTTDGREEIVIATRRRSQQIKSQPPLPIAAVEPEPIQRKSTKRLSLPETEPEPEDIVYHPPGLPPPTIIKSGGATNNDMITIEEEPDEFVDTAETILAALMSKQSQTCPNCMKFFRFAGSLKNHLKVCTEEYFASFDIEDDQNESSHAEEYEMAQIKVESEDEVDVEEEDDEERMEIDEEEEEVNEKFNIEDHDADTEGDNTMEDSSTGTQPYYYQLEYRRCWLCEAVVARFYNLKRHLAQVHKIKMTTNEIHTHQNQLLGSTPTSHRNKIRAEK